jgi:hypothetical protein
MKSLKSSVDFSFSAQSVNRRIPVSNPKSQTLSTHMLSLLERRQFRILLEAPSGLEPLHRGFADLSLSHLGTAP